MKLPASHARAKELTSDQGSIVSTIHECTKILPQYVTLVELMAEEIQVLREKMLEISGYRYIRHTEGIAGIALKALAEADEIEKRIGEIK